MSRSTADNQVHLPRIVPLLNPIVGRLMSAGMPAGPNVLLTVTGRRTGIPRTFPVALLEVDGRMFVQSPYGEVDWVRNLRLAGTAILGRRHARTPVDATELSPEEGGRILRDALAPFRRNRITARFAQVFVALRPDATLEEHVSHVRHHPMFELRPDAAAGARSDRRACIVGRRDPPAGRQPP